MSELGDFQGSNVCGRRKDMGQKSLTVRRIKLTFIGAALTTNQDIKSRVMRNLVFAYAKTKMQNSAFDRTRSIPKSILLKSVISCF